MAVKASATVTLSSVVDVKSVWRYYKLQASTLSKPSKPTTNPPSGWTTTEPSYTDGSTNSLYFCDLTVFCDNSFSYSDVSLSSSYEAAKAAYNKAKAAKDAADNAQNTANSKGIDYSQGKMLYTDPTFASGVNSTKVYNNSSNGTVTVTRTAKSSDNPFSGTSYELTISNTGSASPGCGGFSFQNSSRANAVFIYRIFAKIPTGRNIIWAANAFGSGSSLTWLTSQAGTGKFTEYVCKAVCGATGSFSTIGFFYIDGSVGSSSSPVKWYVAYATCFDMTTTSDTSSVIKRVTAAETSITNNTNEIKLKATKTEVTEAIDDIQVGGRNLLVNTNTNRLSWNVSGGNGTITRSSAISRSLGTYYDKFEITKKSTNWAYIGINDPDAIKEVIRVGGEFTLSFDVFCDAAVTISDIKIKNGDGTKAILDFGYFDTVAAEWTKIKLTGKVKSGVDYSSQIIFISLTSLAEESLIEFSNVKLEKGNKATDWTPAPEDMLSTAEAAETYTTQTEFTQTSEEIRMDFTKSIQTTSSEFQDKIDETNTSMSEKFGEINKYIRFVDGKIILGETGNELTLTIQNDRVSFTQSGVEVAYFSNSNLYVKKAEILTTLRIGNHEFTPRADGGLALRKRSV